MAQKGHIKVIKDTTGGAGGISLGNGGTGTGDVGPVGGVLTPPDLSTVVVTVTSVNSGLDIDFNVPYYACLLLNVGDLVRYEVIKGMNGIVDMPVYVERIPAGVVATINADNASGTITERISNKVINFYQAHLSELQIKVGDNVKYSLVYTTGGEIALNVQEA